MQQEIAQQLSFDIANTAEKFASNVTNPWLFVSIQHQTLCLVSSDQIQHSYIVSTSKYGTGCTQDSYKTPTGAHVIAERIGADQPQNTIFKARQATTELADIIQAPQVSDQDLILSRILRLKGLEQDVNLGAGVDSYQRYIYIHGTHEEGILGAPASHGCVRMANSDVIRLYDQVIEGTFVYIM